MAQASLMSRSCANSSLKIVEAPRMTGASTLSIVQVNARDSQQRPIQLVTSEANVQVKP